MATVMPTLGVVRRVTDVVGTSRTWEGSPVNDLFESLLLALPSDALRAQLPSALGEALMTLRLAPERLRLALDVITEFDLFEASDGVARLLRDAGSDEVAIHAAVLATHPLASQRLKDVVELSAPVLLGSSRPLRAKLEMTRDSSYRPETQAQWMALVSVWPGRSRIGSGDPPVIGVAVDAGPIGQQFELLLEARRAGARIRRVPTDMSLANAHWLPRDAAVIVRPGSGEPFTDRGTLPGSIRAESGLGPAARQALLRRADRLLPRDRRLRLIAPSSEFEAQDPFEDVDAFLAGAFRTNEMAFLSGLSRDRVAQISKDHDELAPHQFRGSHYWGFPALVGLRAWAFAQKQTKKRLNPELAARFVRFATSERAVPIAITAKGEVLFEVTEGTFSGDDGQLTNEVFFVAGSIAQTFVLGSKRAVPALLTPSPMTAVNPEVQGGSPTVAGTRIKVEVLRRIANHAVADGMAGSSVARYVRERYPVVGEDALEDALRTANDLQAVS